MKVTLSIIKADIGGYTGHSNVHPKLYEVANKNLEQAKKKDILIDYHVTHCGDDLELIMTHTKGEDNKEIHGLAWDTFKEGTAVAQELKLYGAGQDLLSDAFTGVVKGLGPGVAEATFTERKSEPVVVFCMDKTDPSAFNYPVFKSFADPFTTPGLVIDPAMNTGFRFEIWDILEHKHIILNTPEEMYDILSLIGAKSRFTVKRVYPKEGGKYPADEPVAVVSTDKLSEIAGVYVGKDDPVGFVRTQAGLPSQGETLEPYSFPQLVSGWMRGSHVGPLVPCSVEDATPTRFDGPPRVIALGFQLANGKLVGPVDLFKDIAFNKARSDALDLADVMRRHGPFEPHRLHYSEMEYTTLPQIMKKLEPRWKKI